MRPAVLPPNAFQPYPILFPRIGSGIRTHSHRMSQVKPVRCSVVQPGFRTPSVFCHVILVSHRLSLSAPINISSLPFLHLKAVVDTVFAWVRPNASIILSRCHVSRWHLIPDLLQDLQRLRVSVDFTRSFDLSSLHPRKCLFITVFNDSSCLLGPPDKK